jgi:hypothetical protein
VIIKDILTNPELTIAQKRSLIFYDIHYKADSGEYECVKARQRNRQE